MILVSIDVIPLETNLYQVCTIVVHIRIYNEVETLGREGNELVPVESNEREGLVDSRNRLLCRKIASGWIDISRGRIKIVEEEEEEKYDEF